MKKKYGLSMFFLIFIVIINAQVGIRLNSEVPPTGYIFPNPSAAVDVYSNSKGLLLPRINLGGANSIINNAAPVSAPKKGLILYNNTAGTTPVSTKSVYYWENGPLSATGQYNKVYQFLETPKVINISFSNDLEVLKDMGAGNRTFYCSQTAISPNNGNANYQTFLQLAKGYLYNSRIDYAYFDTLGQTYGVVLPAGAYNFEVNYNLNISSSTTDGRSSTINIAPTASNVNNNFYDAGYFSDIYYTPYQVTTASTPITFGSALRLRSEAHTVTRADQDHSVSYFYSVSFSADTLVFFAIGRVQNTSHNNAAIMKTNGSFINITKVN